MQTNYANFFDGTPRPGWSGHVSVSARPFRQARSFSDTRRQVGLLGFGGNRPTKVEGVVLTITTRGRIHNIAVQGRNLRYTSQDVGHLFALSSGGPEVDTQYVPQNYSINRAPASTGGPVEARNLNWRQLELYAQYLSQIGFDPNPVAPGAGDMVTIQRRGGGANGRPTFLINNHQMTFYPPEHYQNIPAPSMMIRWRVTPIYPRSGSLALPRGNDPSFICVELDYQMRGQPGNWITFLSESYKNRPKVTAEARMLMKPERNLRERRRAHNNAVAYALAHPRRVRR